jgi:hypothetical protein
VAYLGEILTDPLTKKLFLITTGGLQQHPQGGRQERVLMVLAEAGGGHWYQGKFYTIKASRVNTQLNNSEQFHYAAIPIFLAITISIFI